MDLNTSTSSDDETASLESFASSITSEGAYRSSSTSEKAMLSYTYTDNPRPASSRSSSNELPTQASPGKFPFFSRWFKRDNTSKISNQTCATPSSASNK